MKAGADKIKQMLADWLAEDTFGLSLLLIKLESQSFFLMLNTFSSSYSSP